jgi:hypothetical protein
MVNEGITVRGAGPAVAILQGTNGARLGTYIPGSSPSPMIIAGPQRCNSDETATALNADAAQGMNSVQVASTAGFSVGQILLMDEVSGAGWETDPLGRGQMWASPDFRVVWKKHNPPLPYEDFPSGTYPYSPGSAGCWFSKCDRPISYACRGCRLWHWCAARALRGSECELFDLEYFSNPSNTMNKERGRPQLEF